MSLDNPSSTDETDKPPPPKPAPAETGSSTEVYDPDADALAAEALSEPPISWDADPVPVSRQGAADSQGNGGSASASADGYGQSGQDAAGVPGSPAAWDDAGRQGPPPESGSPLEQPGNGSSTGTADGGAEVYDPDADALAAEALAEPPINWDADPYPVQAPVVARDYGFDDDPAPAYGSPDGAADAETQGTEAEPAARQRSAHDAQEQPAAPGREQAEAESGAESGDSQRQEAERGEQAARETPPVPPPDYSDTGRHAPADADPPPDVTTGATATADVAEPTATAALPAETERVTEADGGQDNADAALIAAQAGDAPATPAASSGSELPGEQESQPAERPGDPAASLLTTEALTPEPGTLEPGPEETARQEDPLATIVAEPGTAGDTDPGEATIVPEAESAQVSAAEHDPQTQDPEPEPETVLPLAETGDPASTDAVPSTVGETTDPALPGEQQSEEAASEAAPDETAEATEQISLAQLTKLLDERDAANEQRQAERDAERNAEREQEQAEHKAEMDELRARLDASEAEVEELKAQRGTDAAAAEAEHQSGPDGVPPEGNQTKPAEGQPGSPDSGDGRDAPSGAASADVAAFTARTDGEAPGMGQAAAERTERRWLTLKNASALSSVVSFGSSIAAMMAHVPPEIAVGTAGVGMVSGLAGSALGTYIKESGIIEKVRESSLAEKIRNMRRH